MGKYQVQKDKSTKSSVNVHTFSSILEMEEFAFNFRKQYKYVSWHWFSTTRIKLYNWCYFFTEDKKSALLVVYISFINIHLCHNMLWSPGKKKGFNHALSGTSVQPCHLQRFDCAEKQPEWGCCKSELWGVGFSASPSLGSEVCLNSSTSP